MIVFLHRKGCVQRSPQENVQLQTDTDENACPKYFPPGRKLWKQPVLDTMERYDNSQMQAMLRNDSLDLVAVQFAQSVLHSPPTADCKQRYRIKLCQNPPPYSESSRTVATAIWSDSLGSTPNLLIPVDRRLFATIAPCWPEVKPNNWLSSFLTEPQVWFSALLFLPGTVTTVNLWHDRQHEKLQGSLHSIGFLLSLRA